MTARRSMTPESTRRVAGAHRRHSGPAQSPDLTRALRPPTRRGRAPTRRAGEVTADDPGGGVVGGRAARRRESVAASRRISWAATMTHGWAPRRLGVDLMSIDRSNHSLELGLQLLFQPDGVVACGSPLAIRSLRVGRSRRRRHLARGTSTGGWKILRWSRSGCRIAQTSSGSRRDTAVEYHPSDCKAH